MHTLIKYKVTVYTPDEPKWKQETAHYQTYEGAETAAILRSDGKLRAEIFERTELDAVWILLTELNHFDNFN